MQKQWEESLLSYSWCSKIIQWSQNWVLELLTPRLPVLLVLAKFYTKLSILAEWQVQEQMSGMHHESRHNPAPNFLSDKLGYFWLQVGIPLLSAICWNPVHLKTKERAVKYLESCFAQKEWFRAKVNGKTIQIIGNLYSTAESNNNLQQVLRLDLWKKATQEWDHIRRCYFKCAVA